MTDDHEKIKPLPLLIGPANAEAVTGTPWRHVREHARAMGVPVLRAGRKCMVRADAYLAALEREQSAETATTSTAPVDPAEAVRELLRRAGGQ